MGKEKKRKKDIESQVEPAHDSKQDIPNTHQTSSVESKEGENLEVSDEVADGTEEEPSEDTENSPKPNRCTNFLHDTVAPVLKQAAINLAHNSARKFCCCFFKSEPQPRPPTPPIDTERLTTECKHVNFTGISFETMITLFATQLPELNNRAFLTGANLCLGGVAQLGYNGNNFMRRKHRSMYSLAGIGQASAQILLGLGLLGGGIGKVVLDETHPDSEVADYIINVLMYITLVLNGFGLFVFLSNPISSQEPHDQNRHPAATV